MIVDSKIYKGIEYIQLSELPQTQRDLLDQTLNKDLFIKILIDGSIIKDCLQFKDYSFWYNSVFQPKALLVKETVLSNPLAFNEKQLVFE